MVERGLVMVAHAAILGILLYGIMVLILKQDGAVAENRSILLAAILLIYMIVFGHGLPTSINKAL